MPVEPPSALSANQQAMLDLALACDLQTSDPAAHDTIVRRHHAIKDKSTAAKYILEVETRIHSRRKTATN